MEKKRIQSSKTSQAQKDTDRVVSLRVEPEKVDLLGAEGRAGVARCHRGEWGGGDMGKAGQQRSGYTQLGVRRSGAHLQSQGT